MPSIEGGGVEKNLFIVTNYLALMLKKVTLITISKKFKKKFNKFVKFKTLNSNFWDLRSRRFKYFLAILILVREILKDKKVIVFAFQANIYAIIICKLLNVKIIVRSNSAPIGWSKNIFKQKIFKFFLKRADQVMVNSSDFKKSLYKRFNVKAECIFNPLNKREIIVKSKKRSPRFFKSKNKLKILNIGRFTDQKDQLTLLKSLNKIKNLINYEAIIVGRGVLKENLINYIKNHKLEKFVKIQNFLENPYPIIKQCDLFVLTSKFEGLPNVLLETAVLKKFIISSNCETGPKEILLNGKSGLLFKVGDYKSLTKKIVFFNKNKTRLKKMVNLNYSKLDRYDLKKNLKKYLNFVNKDLQIY